MSGGALVALAIPAFQLHLAASPPDTYPRSIPAVETYVRMQDAFPGTAPLPASVVVKASDVNALAVQAAILSSKSVRSGGRMHEPITVEVNDDSTVANITVPMEGDGEDAASRASLATLRDDIVPATVGALPEAETGVTGPDGAVGGLDGRNQVEAAARVRVRAPARIRGHARRLPLARDRGEGDRADLLSVAAAYGVLVLVFQHGIGKDFLGFQLDRRDLLRFPLLLFVILFGLSMDYHVFILSRIREAFQRGVGSDESIAYGIRSTAESSSRVRDRDGLRVRDLVALSMPSSSSSASGSRPRSSSTPRSSGQCSCRPR